MTHFPNHMYSEEKLLRDSIGEDPSTPQGNKSTDQPPTQQPQRQEESKQTTPTSASVPRFQSIHDVDFRKRWTDDGEQLD